MSTKNPRWHRETLVCAVKGHVTPAADVARLRPEDGGLGLDLADGRRFARCTRCDLWIATWPSPSPKAETLPPLDQLPVPRRGKELREALVLRLIAIDRGLHAIIFGLLAAGLIALETHLGQLKGWANSLLRSVNGAISSTGQDPSRSFLARELQHVMRLQQGAIKILLFTAVAYCVVEAVEAVGLWLERRWAEYLTVVATAGFLPFEIDELLHKVTVLRVGALIINVAVLIYLVWAKRLFGLRGGAGAEREEFDRAELLGPPAPRTDGAAARPVVTGR